MSKPILEINRYNDAEGMFEPCAVKTTAEAVEFEDGETLSTKMNGLEASGSSIIVSETQPENPKDGLIWIQPVNDGTGGEA